MITTPQKRLLLRKIYAGGGVLLTNLQTYAFARAAAISAGVLQSVSANGHSQSMSVGDQTTTLVDLAEGAEALLTCYDDSRAALVAAGTASPTDAAIYTEMLFRLQPITQRTSDFTYMREVTR